MEILAKEVQREFHRGILGVIATDEFALCFRKIKRRAIRFSKKARVEDDRGKRLLHDVPLACELRANNVVGIE